MLISNAQIKKTAGGEDDRRGGRVGKSQGRSVVYTMRFAQGTSSVRALMVKAQKRLSEAAKSFISSSGSGGLMMTLAPKRWAA